MGEEDGAKNNRVIDAFGSMCCGWILFPLSLYLLGWNEQMYMCNHKSILFADKQAKVVQCDKPDAEDGIAFLSCPIKEDSLPTWTAASFGAGGLGNAIHFKSAAGAMKAEMFQCVEYSKTEKHGNDSVKVYSYKMEWKDRLIDVYHFGWTAQAIQARDYACPGLQPGQGGHLWPSDVPQGLMTKYAPRLKAGPLYIDSKLIADGGEKSGLLVNMATPMNLAAYAGNFKKPFSLPMSKMVQSITQPITQHATNWYTQVVQNPHFGGQPAGPGHHPPAHHPPQHHSRRLFEFQNPFGHKIDTLSLSSVNPQNAAVDPTGDYIITCQEPRIGCIRIQFFKNWDTSVTMVSAVQGGSTLPVDVPESWGCGTAEFQALQGGPVSKKVFFAEMMDANTSSTWMMRVFGLLLTWLAVYCCFSPIATAIDIVGDCIRGVPCLGPFLEDLLEGMVTCILCVVSCGFGCSSGLFVIAVVWLYMRPMVGGIMMLISAVLVGGAYYYGKTSKTESSRNLVSELVPMAESNEA